MAPLNSGMKRRHFLKALGTAAVALALPSIAAPAAREGWGTGSARPNLSKTELQFHPEAFTDAAQSLADAIDREGIRIIMMTRFTVAPDRKPCRIDIRYGYGCLSPSAVARIPA